MNRLSFVSFSSCGRSAVGTLEVAFRASNQPILVFGREFGKVPHDYLGGLIHKLALADPLRRPPRFHAAGMTFALLHVGIRLPQKRY